MKLIKILCQSLVGKKVKLIRSDYICPVDDVPVTYFRPAGKIESKEDERFVTGEIVMAEPYDEYPLDRFTLTISVGDDDTRYLTVSISDKIKIVE